MRKSEVFEMFITFFTGGNQFLLKTVSKNPHMCLKQCFSGGKDGSRENFSIFVHEM